MESKAPNSFTRSDKDIITRGLLPQISVSATEDEVQNEICQVVCSCTIPILSEIGPKDFRFINLDFNETGELSRSWQGQVLFISD